MKFCEKLQNLRKEKGYSQEELADLLDVSRQSVSKWESGTTYPEMDKLLSLCKIFNVSLDDLTNDDVTKEMLKEKNKNSFSNLIYTILDMINKSIEMFKQMSRSDIVKTIIELLILIGILFIFKIPFNYINRSINNVLLNFPIKVYEVLQSIWLFISNMIYLVLFIAVLLYVYKTRYLDKFNSLKKEAVSDETEVTKEVILEPKKDEVKKEVKKDIEKKHSFIIFDFLGTLLAIFGKIVLLVMGIPTIIMFLVLIVLGVLSLSFIITGGVYIGIFIGLIGAILICFVFMDLIITVLFDHSASFKKLFVVFTLGLVFAGVGVGIGANEIANTKYKDEIPSNIKLDKSSFIYKMNKDLVMEDCGAYKCGSVTYIEDDSKNDEVVIEVEYYKDYQDVVVNLYGNKIYFNSYSDFENEFNIFKLVKQNLKDKTFYNYNLLADVSVNVITSSKNIEILKNNFNKMQQEEERENSQYQAYENQISDLEIEIARKNERIESLEEKIGTLEEKLRNIEDAFN